MTGIKGSITLSSFLHALIKNVKTVFLGFEATLFIRLSQRTSIIKHLQKLGRCYITKAARCAILKT